MTKIAITGASGFLGSIVANFLREQGYHILPLSRNSSHNYQQVDYQSIDSLKYAFQDCHAIIHLAGIAHTRKFQNNDKEYEEAIKAASLNIRSAALQCGVEHILYASSIKVFGNSAHVHGLNEYSPCHPQDSYGKYKREVELKYLSASQVDQMKTTILRLPPVYGQGMKGSVKYLFNSAKLYLPLPIHHWKHKRTFLSADNMARIIFAILQGKLVQPIYNLCDSPPLTPGEFYCKLWQGAHGYHLPNFLQFKLPRIMTPMIKRMNSLSAITQDFPIISQYQDEINTAELLSVDEAIAYCMRNTYLSAKRFVPLESQS